MRRRRGGRQQSVEVEVWRGDVRLSMSVSAPFTYVGITENLTTDLSRIRNSFVIAPGTESWRPLRHSFHGRSMGSSRRNAKPEEHAD